MKDFNPSQLKIRRLMEIKMLSVKDMLRWSFVLGLLASNGCVSLSKSKRLEKQAYEKGVNVTANLCRQEAEKYFDPIWHNLQLKTERLEIMHQLDKSGQLVPISPCYQSPNAIGCGGKVTGKESWQK